MDCPNQSFNENKTLRCSLLAGVGLTHYAGVGNPHYPCDRCKANWIKDAPPTKEALGPILYGIITVHQAQQAALDPANPAPAPVDPPPVALAAAPDGQVKGCGGCGGHSQAVKDRLNGRGKRRKGLNR